MRANRGCGPDGTPPSAPPASPLTWPR